MWSDPIADMLTRIRNANSVFKESLEVPASNLKRNICELLKREGYISDFRFIEDKKQGTLSIKMKYTGARRNRRRIINGIVKVSKGGRRVYVSKDSIHRVKGGLGIAILSTSKGILTDKDARRLGVGGEVLAYIW
ncbi:MAG TPA: 30S ribosomal protein S8 [Thermotogota bacterium]|nr:30S ribosomal protein S8 [Thermotogota bacterium]HRW91362.1 30S ribosomal protein S8 [Thermotogota bacterium]